MLLRPLVFSVRLQSPILKIHFRGELESGIGRNKRHSACKIVFLLHYITSRGQFIFTTVQGLRIKTFFKELLHLDVRYKSITYKWYFQCTFLQEKRLIARNQSRSFPISENDGCWQPQDQKKKVLIAISWCFHTAAAERTVMLEVIKSISPRGFCFLFFCCCCWKKWPPVNGPEYLLCNLQSPHIFNEDNFHVSLLIRKIILTSWRTKKLLLHNF